MSEVFVRAQRLCFSWPDGTPVFDALSLNLGPVRTGLVAPNGAGKSTLLRLLAGVLTPQSGTVAVGGRLAYLPQHLPLSADTTVAEVLGVSRTLDALSAIAGGAVDPALFEQVGEDWDLQERLGAGLARVGLDGLAMQRRLDSLSGGEVMALGLAAQLLRRPDVLLLDEPSNNLDRRGRQRLMAVLDDWRGCLVVASHDRGLLEHVDQVAELEPSTLGLHGGGFAHYRDAVDAEQAAAEQDVRQLRRAVAREKQQRQAARERAERRAGNARRTLPDAGIPRIAAGTLKRAAQVSAGRADDVHASRVEAARAQMREAASRLREAPDLDLSLPATRPGAGQVLFHGRGLQVVRDGRTLYAAAGLDLDIRGPQRIALTGGNGCGKSTLLRIIAGLEADATGEVRRHTGRTALLSQRLDLLDPARSVAANFVDFTPDTSPTQRANLLARWLFRGARQQLPVGALSGGERLRAVLACVLHAQPAPQLLLLDEPTNNLDLATTAELEAALRAYQGALVVVSHDADFLAAVEPYRRLALVDGRLQERAGTGTPPA